ncbi:unnamed protein product, partial [Allacma fusca]
MRGLNILVVVSALTTVAYNNGWIHSVSPFLVDITNRREFTPAITFLNYNGAKILDAVKAAKEYFTAEEPKEETLSDMTAEAEKLFQEGNFRGSFSKYETIFETNKRKLGPRHQDTLSAEAQMANALQVNGNIQEASIILNKVLASQRHTLGMSHQQTLRTASFLAKNMRKQGKYKEALLRLEKLLQ